MLNKFFVELKKITILNDIQTPTPFKYETFSLSLIWKILDHEELRG